MFAKKGVFGQLEKTGFSQPDDDGWRKRICTLGEEDNQCSRYTMDKNTLVFEEKIGTLDSQTDLGNDILINTTPARVEVRYRCGYSTTIQVSSDAYSVSDIDISGAASG